METLTQMAVDGYGSLIFTHNVSKLFPDIYDICHFLSNLLV